MPQGRSHLFERMPDCPDTLESNGSYSYTEHDPQQNQPGYDPSPRLFLSKAEKSILNGFAESAGTMSHISLGFDPGYGG